MTKRFTVPVKYRFSHSKIQLNGEPLTNDELVRILNTNDGAFVENFSLKQENEQLKERNQRQAKRLAELYELMAKKDWESLTEIIEDFCSCEEQLQREWRTYE